jgi:hypothetical protein
MEVEPQEENGEELIDDRGRDVTQRRIDEESGLDSPGEAAGSERDEEWFEGANPEATPL